MKPTQPKPACKARIMYGEVTPVAIHAYADENDGLNVVGTNESHFIAPATGNGLPELRAFWETMDPFDLRLFFNNLEPFQREMLGIRAPKKAKGRK